MTIFSALITSGILILMAIASLVIFERGLTRNSYERFLNNGNSCVAYLETQSVLSHKWILEAKQEYGVELRILNNGKRLFFDKLNEESSSNASGENGRKSSVENMLAEAARISREEQGLDVEYTGSISLPKEVYFETADFYACTALIPKGSGVLSLVLVYPLDGLKGQIFHQRILWGGLLLIAVLALVVFSWFFTGKMLRPLEENRKRQTQFIASASHELRSPLAVILSSVQAIEADPGECRRFLSTIKSEGTDMVVGDRLSSTYFTENKRPFHNFGNSIVRGSINRLFKSDIKDIMTGYRAMSYRFVKTFPVLSRNFEIETEMTIHAIDKNMQVENVIIEYRDRPEGSESKLNTYADGFKVLKTIMRMFKNYKPLEFFSIIAAVLFVVGMAFFIPVLIHFLEVGTVNKLPTLIVSGFVIMTAIICWFSGIILSTLVNQHKQDFEFQTQMVTNRYKDLFPEEK